MTTEFQFLPGLGYTLESGHAHMFGWYRSYREPLPLSARSRGEREGPGAVASGG
jgi:hypothetical protein